MVVMVVLSVVVGVVGRVVVEDGEVILPRAWQLRPNGVSLVSVSSPTCDVEAVFTLSVITVAVDAVDSVLSV